MSNISQKPGPADQAKTKAQLLAELNELRRRVAQWETAERLPAETGLPSYENWFRLIFETTHQGIWQVNPQGVILSANQSMTRMLGYPVAELVGRSLFDFVDESDLARYRAIFRNRQRGQAEEAEIRLRRKDGSDLWVLLSATPVMSDQGELLFSVGMFTDITERKQAEAQLRESEYFAQATIDALPEHLCVLDEAGVIIAVNRAWREFAQANPPVPANYSLGVNYLEVCDRTSGPEQTEAASFAAGIRAVIRGEVEAFSLEYPCPATWEPRWFIGVVTRFPGEGPVRVVVNHQNITLIKQAEKALVESERKFRQIVERSNDAIVLTDETGRMIEWNAAATQIVGLQRAEVVGQRVWDVQFRLLAAERQTPVVYEQFKSHLQTYFQTGQHPWLGQVNEGEIQRSDGLRRMLQSAEFSIKTEGGYLLGSVIRDVTELKQTEARLRESEVRFHSMFVNHAAVMLLVEPISGEIIEANLAAARFYGYPVLQLCTMNIAELNMLPPDQIQLERQNAQNEARNYFVFPHRLANGEIRTVEVHSSPIALANQPILFSIIHDVTERQQAEAALRESEQKFRQVIEYSGDAVVVTDETGRIVEWNPAAAQITGLARAAVLGRASWEVQFDLLPPERRTPDAYEQLKVRNQIISQTGQSQRLGQPVEVEIQRPNGSYRDIQTVDFSIKTGLGFWRGSIIRDVTERKQVERVEAAQLAVSSILAGSPETAVALKQVLEAIASRQEWQLAELWWRDGAGIRLHRVWQDGGYTLDQSEWAEAEQASQGYTLEPGAGLAGAVWQAGQALWDQDLRSPQRPRAALAAAAGLHSAAGIPIIRDEAVVGVMTFFSRSARPLEERLLAVLTDLGRQIGQFLARKEAEESLHRYEQMVATSPDWLSLVDRNYVYRIVNQTYLTFNNKSYDQIVGHSVVELFGETVFTTVIKPRLDQALAGETVQYQEWFDFPAAGQRFVNITYAPYREKDGTISGVAVSGRDMTEAKLLEEHLQQVQKMGAIGQLAAGMAHHYNSMLTTIIGFTSLSLHTLPPDAPIAKNLEQVLHTAERMAVLVRQLLAFAQKQLLQPKPASLNDLILRLQSEQKLLVPAPIEFALDLAPEVGQVKVDPRQFEYLLRALVSNAVDAMPQGGRLTLTTASVSLGEVEAGWYGLSPGDYVLLTVKDTGIGLTDEVKAHLFEPFFTTKEVGQGTGLGLAMALGIAKQHSGHLFAESEAGQGATFMLYLPCLTPPPPSLPPVRSASAQTILLIEAELMVREFVAEILSDQGYTVLKAGTTEVALQRMAGRPEVSLQLLLTPAHSNSPALIEQLKANSPHLKVIFLIDEVEDLSFELKETRADFLLKPFAPSGLMQKIRAVLEAVPE